MEHQADATDKATSFDEHFEIVEHDRGLAGVNKADDIDIVVSRQRLIMTSKS
jgi:hypothetical protein